MSFPGGGKFIRNGNLTALMDMVILPGLNQKLDLTATKEQREAKQFYCTGFVAMETVVVSLGAAVDDISAEKYT